MPEEAVQTSSQVRRRTLGVGPEEERRGTSVTTLVVIVMGLGGKIFIFGDTSDERTRADPIEI